MSTEDGAIYDHIGAGYAVNRQPDVRWAQQIHAALAPAQTLVNVGAGSGSYEPPFMNVVAVEPAATMLRQRPADAAPAVQAVAEGLPFADGAFDVALAVLTTHHWRDAALGLREMQRVARRQVVVTWEPDQFARDFWLVRDYLPQLAVQERGLATLHAVMSGLGDVRVEPLLVPADCTDGVLGAHWRRPQEYLKAPVRASMSGLALLDQTVVGEAMARLARDLENGAWARTNAQLLGLPAADLGYRVIVAGA